MHELGLNALFTLLFEDWFEHHDILPGCGAREQEAEGGDVRASLGGHLQETRTCRSRLTALDASAGSEESSSWCSPPC